MISKNTFILASVFLTGMAVLIVEIAALRILTPYYGNTIYTASAVISVVLAGLSFGYYFGGKVSDQRPDYGLFSFIIFLAGLLVIFSYWLDIVVLPIANVFFSLQTGPLVFSLALFFVPAFLLGMLSPFAIKLNSQGNKDIGGQSGSVFFWSTLGSITGSLATGFLFIPHLGVSKIIFSTGLALSLLGTVNHAFFVKNKKTFLAMVSLLLLAGLFGFLTLRVKPAGLVYQKDGLYEKITVVDGQWNEEPARFLFQDKSYSAAMYLNSDSLVYDFTKYAALLPALVPKARKALVIGGGGYSIPKYLQSALPNLHVDVAEIEPELFSLAKKYFRLEDTSYIANHTEDGRRFLAKSQGSYDLIFSDVYYSLFSVPLHFTTKEFFTLAKEKLSEKGIFIANLGGYLYGPKSAFLVSEIKTFQEVFDNGYFFAARSPKFDQIQNIMLVGLNAKEPVAFDGLNGDEFLRLLPSKMIDVLALDFSKAKTLTDDYAPVEYLVGKMLN